MKNDLLSLFLIWTILVVTLGLSDVSAQTITKEIIQDINSQKVENILLNKNLDKKLNLSKTNVLESPVNFNEIQKDSLKNVPRRKMSSKRKAMWIAVVIGAAVGMFFLIKYAKECEIYESNCSLDEVCPCLKYKEETK